MAGPGSSLFPGEIAQPRSHGEQTVASGLGERAGQPEELDGIDAGHERLARSGIVSAEKVASQNDQSPDQRRVAVAEEPRRILVGCTDDPYLGLASDHAIGFDALGFREGRAPAGAVDHGTQTFLQILDHREVVEKSLLMGGEWHGRRLCSGWSGIKRALYILAEVGMEDGRTQALKACGATMTNHGLIPLP